MGVTNAPEFTDTVVVGSGFGGAVAAYRMAAAGRSVVVLERGRPYPPGSFARTPAQMGRNFWDPHRGLYGLFDTWTFRGMEGLVSSGLGGGSLIYANVLLRKDERWFVKEAPLPGGGYETWPFDRRDLEQHYEAVEAMLGAAAYPYHDTPKTQAMEDAAQHLDMDSFRPPLAVTFSPAPGRPAAPNQPFPHPAYGNIHGAQRVTCTRVGECDIGCNAGAKNSLDHTYLSAAAYAGAEIRCLHEVRGLRPLENGGYEVRYIVHDPERGDVSSRSELPPRVIRCRTLVLAAGTFGTTYLLLRNRPSFPALSRALGTKFSGNGDLLTLLMDAEHPDGSPRTLHGSFGPVITTTLRARDEVDGGGPGARGYYIQDAGYPAFLDWLVETGQIKAVAQRTGRVAWQLMLDRLLHTRRSNISYDMASALGDGRRSAGSLPLLGMGRDIADGVMSLSEGHLAVNWTVATSKDYFAVLRARMQDIATELGADFHDNPLWWSKRVVTVHPLGGAPAGRHRAESVCDEYGEVFGHPGLYVLDGAAMPGPVGANPALTIAAFSDRACEHLLDSAPAGQRLHDLSGSARRVEEGAPAVARVRPPAPGAPPEQGTAIVPGSPASPGTSVAFTERMRGPFALGEADPVRGARAGRVRGERLMFRLTITVPDVEGFVRDPLHPATATGQVHSDVLGGTLPVDRGWFNLFVHPPGLNGRKMLYRLWMRDNGGTPLTLLGYKQIVTGDGIGVWKDTTTLYTRVVGGHLPPPDTLSDTMEVFDYAHGTSSADAPVLGSGLIIIHGVDFARQLTTFRAQGPDPLGGLRTFGQLFFGQLWKVYGPVVLGRRPSDPPSRS